MDACTLALPKVLDCIETGDLQGQGLNDPKWINVAPTPAGSGPNP